MREEITADWAKKTANSVLNDKIKGQINIVLNDIEQSVKNNRFTTNIQLDLHELTIADIRERGFEIKKNTTNYEGYGSITSYTINWDK
jgi:hypothetical protein